MYSRTLDRTGRITPLNHSRRVSVSALATTLIFSLVAYAKEVLPNDPTLSFSDVATYNVTPDRARFDRLINDPNGFRHESPGARIRFRTDSTDITACLFYNGLNTRPDAVNGIGCWLVNGKIAGTFAPPRKTPAKIDISILKGGVREERQIEIILPYGESVDFEKFLIDDGAKISTASNRPQFRYIAYGDSITHGFRATGITKDYPFQVGEIKDWQVINMGFGSRAATSADSTVITSLKPDLITILIGFNDHYQSKALETFRNDILNFIKDIRKTLPTVPIYLITPLWSTEPFESKLHLSLEDYRNVIRQIAVSEKEDSNLHLIEGLDLVDHDPKFFSDGIHPNDEGFRQLAIRLAKKLEKP